MLPSWPQGKESDEGATTGTITPRSVGTCATLSGKSSAGHKAATPVGSEDGGGSGGGGGSSSGKRERGITAGGAGVSRKVVRQLRYPSRSSNAAGSSPHEQPVRCFAELQIEDLRADFQVDVHADSRAAHCAILTPTLSTKCVLTNRSWPRCRLHA